jgi:hypothetical protein
MGQGRAHVPLARTSLQFGPTVSDIFDQACINPIRVRIIAGFEAQHQSKNRWKVLKIEIVSTLDAQLQAGELLFAASLRDAITDERFSPAGRGGGMYDQQRAHNQP